jgi:ABC-type multidrug transport system fused ATPase/permease subunit
MTARQQNQMRRGIGMIFQHFNLLERSTVFDNIAYPLKYTGRSREEIRRRVLELLDTESEIREDPDAEEIPAGSGEVAFENVTFTYEGAELPALDDVSFTVAQGQTVALVGPSGGGKTTAASLIPRFWDVDEGSVRVRFDGREHSIAADAVVCALGSRPNNDLLELLKEMDIPYAVVGDAARPGKILTAVREANKLGRSI